MLKKCVLFALLLTGIAAFYHLGFADGLSLGHIQEKQEQWRVLQSHYPLTSALVFMLAYIVITGLSLPGAAALTLLAGALFGLVWGTVLVSFASSIGALLAFLLARYLLTDLVAHYGSEQLARINRGIAKDGAFYLFSLRLVPLFPFFLVNILMALTQMRWTTFYWVSQLGMLPATLVYVNAGRQLASITQLSHLIAWPLVLAFCLLALFPWCAKCLLKRYQHAQAYRPHRRPARYSHNLIVIGAGAAGLVSAYIAAKAKAKVMLIEQHKMGGDCLNTGCVPSKALIHVARFMAQCRQASQWGITLAPPHVDFTQVMAHVQQTIRHIEPHDSVERYHALGVQCVQGDAELVSPWSVRVSGETYTSRRIIVASGASPVIPAIPGIDRYPYLTSESIWQLTNLPRHLVVVGGGPIGCELAQAFAFLGAKVTLIEVMDSILVREDNVISATMTEQLSAAGVDIKTGTRVTALVADNRLQYTNDSEKSAFLDYDQILFALGRRPRIEGFGLETLGVDVNAQGAIIVDDYLQTSVPSIYACGDVVGPYQFTHMAAHQAWYAAMNSLLLGLKRFAVDYRLVPAVTFTYPEVARCGHNEQSAQAANLPFEVTTYAMSELDRAITEDATVGYIRVLTKPGRDSIIGVTIVADRAGELLAAFVFAMRHGLGLNHLLMTIHAYPTWMEANKFVAANWRAKNIPEWAYRLSAQFHRILRHDV